MSPKSATDLPKRYSDLVAASRAKSIMFATISGHLFLNATSTKINARSSARTNILKRYLSLCSMPNREFFKEMVSGPPPINFILLFEIFVFCLMGGLDLI